MRPEQTNVPDLWFPRGRDLLQVLWCPNKHEDIEAYGRTAGELTGPYLRAPEYDVAEMGYLPRPCVLSPERVLE